MKNKYVKPHTGIITIDTDRLLAAVSGVDGTSDFNTRLGGSDGNGTTSDVFGKEFGDAYWDK